MKEATGELNMTVITVVAIAAVAALFYAFVWPEIQRSIATNSCTAAFGETYSATKVSGEWQCCVDGANCVPLD
jgi:hypothetical protein